MAVRARSSWRLSRLAYRVLPIAAASTANRFGASMDLAMAMGLSLFGIFTASTAFFLYRLPR